MPRRTQLEPETTAPDARRAFRPDLPPGCAPATVAGDPDMGIRARSLPDRQPATRMIDIDAEGYDAVRRASHARTASRAPPCRTRRRRDSGLRQGRPAGAAGRPRRRRLQQPSEDADRCHTDDYHAEHRSEEKADDAARPIRRAGRGRARRSSPTRRRGRTETRANFYAAHGYRRDGKLAPPQTRAADHADRRSRGGVDGLHPTPTARPSTGAGQTPVDNVRLKLAEITPITPRCWRRHQRHRQCRATSR